MKRVERTPPLFGMVKRRNSNRIRSKNRIRIHEAKIEGRQEPAREREPPAVIQPARQRAGGVMIHSSGARLRRRAASRRWCGVGAAGRKARCMA